MRLKALLVVMALSTLVTAAPGRAEAALQFTWRTAEPRLLLDSLGNPLIGSQTDPSVGTFVQLIFDGGGDGLAGLDISQNNGLPAAGNDIVLAKAWIGKGADVDNPSRMYGYLLSVDEVEDVGGYAPGVNDNYWIRIFDSPSLNFDGGTIPNTGNYVDVGPRSLSFDELGGGAITFQIDQEQRTLTPVPEPVPEPSSVVLFGLGGLVVAGMGRLRRRVRLVG